MTSKSSINFVHKWTIKNVDAFNDPEKSPTVLYSKPFPFRGWDGIQFSLRLLPKYVDETGKFMSIFLNLEKSYYSHFSVNAEIAILDKNGARHSEIGILFK